MRKSYTAHYPFQPRIIVPKHLSSHYLKGISFVPIEGNRILLLAKYLIGKKSSTPYHPLLFIREKPSERHSVESCLHLSIYEIRSDNRVGSILWFFADNHFHIDDLELIKSTENAFGITLRARLDDHCKLFAISTTETDASVTESGRIDFDLKLHGYCAKFLLAVVLNLL